MAAVDCILKLGGSALTQKSQLETLKTESLRRAAVLVSKLWEAGERRCIIVHGAGKFCAEGKEPLHILSSFANLFTKANQKKEEADRPSELNHLVTEQLISVGVPAVGLSVFGIWKTTNKNITEAGIDAVKDILDAGYIPVLHGDCALDLEQHCCILSGDTIIEVLAKTFCPRRVVFLTDVNGIYSCPPDTPGARLLDSIVIGPERTMEPTVLTSALPHDTTGGVSLKLQTAINIVSWSHGSIPVLICKLDSDAAVKACLTGELEEGEGTKLSFLDT